MLEFTLNKNGGVTDVPGFTASGIHCGIRKNKTKRDLALIFADRMCSVACVYTTNKVKAAPILLTMENMKSGKGRGIVCNSGNANACAPGGMEAAQAMANATAKELKINPTELIVNSTGVIGVELPIDAILTGIPSLVKELSKDNEAVKESPLLGITIRPVSYPG